MQTSYIYSVSRANTLCEYLLTKTDIERLLVAAPEAELQTALKETYLAPYITRLDDEDMATAIELTLIDAKRIVHSTAPQGDIFRVLWVHYDIHNLRVFAKAKKKHTTFAELSQYVSQRGIYEPVVLYEHAESGTLDAMQVGWHVQAVFNKAVSLVLEGKVDQIDALFDELYFTTAKQIAEKSNDDFIKKYLSTTIDIYNLKSRLRALTHQAVVQNATEFITGGTIARDRLETKESTLAALSQLGSAHHWVDAIAAYNQHGHTTAIDVAADEYLVRITKEASRDMFSSASLVLYYLLCRQSAANLRTIVVGKNSGMTEAAIRANLRMTYVNE